MNNTELDKVLREAGDPEPRPGFWVDLPGNIQRQINMLDRPTQFEEPRSILAALIRKAAPPLAVAAACVVFGFILGANARSSQTPGAAELAEARDCWREVAALFPNQLTAIVFDQQGSHVVLSNARINRSLRRFT